MLGCFDTKGEEYSFLYKCIKAHGESVITINTGIMETDVDFPIDFDSDSVALEAGHSIMDLMNDKDRGHAVGIMSNGAAKVVAKLIAEKRIKAVIGMGGGAGTYIVLFAMQEIPFGVPKLCLSTLAGKDLSRQINSKDITLMPSIVDIAGLNSISRLLIKQAAAGICAMSKVTGTSDNAAAGRIAISMFGNTSACVYKCTEILRAEGYEVLPFHANGVGGRAMESLIREGCFDAVLDITTTELADDLCGGVCSAGPDRLAAAAELGVPQVVVPGCLDMVNFAEIDTVPEHYKSRQFYSWSPNVTLMRTNKEENRILGERLAKKINQSSAPVVILLPTKGISQIDAEGGIFYRPEINRVLFDTIKEKTKKSINVIEVDAHINDEKFATMLVSVLLDAINKKRITQ
ncbi:MAG: transcriptional regulator [Segetibacter sp.]|nr:transcriptional regulator [Segetibacter sp.]